MVLFTYLGIHITPSLPDLFKANFTPLTRRIKQDLAHWSSTPLSLLGREDLFKMNASATLLISIPNGPYIIIM